MSEQKIDVNPYFFQLVISLQSAAMFQMGKTVSPISGKIEKDLAQARVSIDLLVMLQEKTKGNLSEEEKRVLDSTIYNLQMNFLDEADKKDEDKSPESADESKGGNGSGNGSGEAAPNAD